MKGTMSMVKELLKKEAYTCVVSNGVQTYTSMEHGVKPLLQWLHSDIDLTGYLAADKVVGNAAAFLYVLLGVKEVYAPVMSKAAYETLTLHGIHAECEVKADAIINRAGTGFCPMEQAVQGIASLEDALAAIEAKLRELKKQ